jgi:osmotically-inducible protein OsmY
MHKSYSFYFLFLLLISQLISCIATTAPAVTGGPIAFADRRTTEVIYIDQKLEFKTILETQDINENDNLTFVSFNQTVLITGEVPDEQTKAKVEEAVKKIKGVKEVKNFLLIGMNSSLKSKGTDVITTSNVVSRLYFNESKFESKLSPLHVKVVTERQEVYLMGILNAKEAEDAIAIAKSSSGVKKVIPLFEINDNYQNTY